MKKTFTAAFFALLFTLAAIISVRAAVLDSPTYPADTLADYLRALAGEKDGKEVPLNDGQTYFIRTAAVDDVPIEAGQYVEEVCRAHFEHDRAENILSFEGEKESVFGSIPLVSAEYACMENGKEVRVLFVSGKKQDRMISFLALFDEADREEAEALLRDLEEDAFFPDGNSTFNCA